MEKREPQWITNAAKTMLQPPKEKYGDEDQDDLMNEIDSKDHEDNRGAQ